MSTAKTCRKSCRLEASGVKIVVDHLGRPDPKSGINSEGFKALLRSIEKGRTWVKVSGGYRLGPQAKEYARELLRVAGPDRLVWASDCPFVGHEGQFPYQGHHRLAGRGHSRRRRACENLRRDGARSFTSTASSDRAAPKAKKPPEGGRFHCASIAVAYWTFDKSELVTTTGLPAFTTWAVWE